jgi:hypothetical protein
MPLISRWMIRLALFYLVVGITLGAVLLINKAIDLHPLLWAALPLHIESLFWGFIMQFTMGTAYWILPRYLQGPGRGNKLWSGAMVIFLNGGILSTLAGSTPYFSGKWIAFGGGLKLIAVVFFIFLHWNRIVKYKNINER